MTHILDRHCTNDALKLSTQKRVKIKFYLFYFLILKFNFRFKQLKALKINRNLKSNPIRLHFIDSQTLTLHKTQHQTVLAWRRCKQLSAIQLTLFI
jgi:hypothetical protein